MEVTQLENLSISELRDKMTASTIVNLYTASKLTETHDLIIYDTIPTKETAQKAFFWKAVQNASGIFKVNVKVNCSFWHYIKNFVFKKSLGDIKVSWLKNSDSFKTNVSLSHNGIINSNLFLEDVFTAYQDTTCLDNHSLTIDIFEKFKEME